MSSSDMDRVARNEKLLERRQLLTEGLASLPYDLVLYLERAAVYADLGYPDLAAGDAYRALLLTDEITNDGFEYHDQALESLERYAGEPLPDVLAHGNLAEECPAVTTNANDEDSHVASSRLAHLASIRAYQILSLSLLLCGCLKSASNFCDRGLAIAPENPELLHTRGHIDTMARQKLRRSDFDVNDLPDFGLVRREVYPWNDHEPDRFSPESLGALNAYLKEMAPKCAVQVATLPVLLEGASETDDYEIIPTCRQLGVFAQDDIEPGEVVLREYSLLTANNRLKDSVCDACSSDLAPLGSENEPVRCDECYDTVFCGQECHDEAQERYHPAVCDKDVDSIAKDSDACEADETLYLLLLARVLALANHQEVHPLDVCEVKFIWGDFVPSRTNEINVSPNAGPPPEWTLPFSFKYSIETPLHVLEKMDIDIYAELAEYDLWVLNTLYAKFRGTASARKNPRDGRPDVAAVHPYWCLANHDCDPNVTWDWGGRMVLSARRERVVGGRPAGIKRGEEILNHYCDVTLPVQQRREWARGSLGGWCMCKRCRTEASVPSRTCHHSPDIMPFPLSDEQLIASFTPLERKFHAWHDTARDIFTQIEYRHSEMERMKREQWPDPDIREQYREWACAWTSRHLDRMRYHITPQEFIDKVRHLNFTSSADVGGFLWMMQMLNPPSLLLGQCEYGGVTTCYLLRPSVCYLSPHLDKTPEQVGVMDRSVLAINMNVTVNSFKSQNRRKQNSSEDSNHSNTLKNSVRTADSGDIDTDQAFVFAQLGRMYSFTGDWNRACHQSKDDIYKGPWEPTDFGVVVQLDKRGRTGAVWVIYNFYKVDPDSEDDTPRHIDVYQDEQILAHIGLPVEGVSAWKRFTVAKIADSLEDLRDVDGGLRGFEFRDTVQDEVMIVRAKVYDGGRWLLPQFVKDR